MRANPLPLIEVRCKNSVTSKRDGKVYRCHALLAKVEAGKGEIRCYKCKHMNFYDVQRGLSPATAIMQGTEATR